MTGKTKTRAGWGQLAGASELVGVQPSRFILAVGLGAVAVVSGVGLAGLAGYLICRAAQQPPILTLTVLMVSVRALALVRPLTRYGERLTSHDMALRALGRVRSRLFARIEPLAPAELEHFRDGQLLTSLVADVDQLADLVLSVALPVLVAVVSAVVIVAVTALVCAPAAGIISAGLVIGGVTAPWAAHRLASGQAAHQGARRAQMTADLIETFDSADELWLCGADLVAARRIDRADAALAESALADSRAAGWSDALVVAVQGITAIAVLVAASAASEGGWLDPLLVCPIVLVALASFEAVRPLSEAGRRLPAALAAAARILDLAGRQSQVRDPANPIPPPPRRPSIATDRVVVSRGRGDGRRVVLAGTSFAVEPGERLVLSGASGSGKSTLAQLLVRFLERDRGEAHLAGEDLRSYSQDDVRNEVLLCFQDPHVFNSNLRENVALARPGADDQAINEALARAQLADWVDSLPEGLDTMVGESGRTLSGGQRQRLAMARAFLADPSVLVVDEPTAHLDRDTAAALLEDLWRTTGDRSVVLISHDDPGAFASARHVSMSPDGGVSG